MRIVHIISGLGTGGAETMLYRLVSQLSNHTHVIISLTSNGSQGQKLLLDGFDVHILDMRGVFGFISLLRLWILLRKINPDIVQTWMYHADLIGGLIARSAGFKNIVWNIRNTKIPQGRYSLTSIFIWLSARLSNWLPRKIICCANAAMVLHRDFGYTPSKLTVIPNGYVFNDFLTTENSRLYAKNALGLPSDAVIVGMIGRFDYLKGYDIFIKAAAILNNFSSRPVLFLAAGCNIDENNIELKRWINNFAPGATFKLLGERSDIPRIMQAIDFFCLASRAEGFPNVVAEAMLMQIPCVVTDVGDAKIIVGPSGLVVPPEDPTALADALKELISLDKKDRIELGLFARQRICDNYSIDAIANEYEKIYYFIRKM
jgi:glycosyltransferase involved in cell wall biosynthesis